MINKFNTTFEQAIFSIEKSNCIFQETENIQYNLNVKWAKNKQMILIRPSEIKEKSTFIKRSAKLPKDCDYVLIDEDKKKIFYIELKHKNNCPAKHVFKQLTDTEKWIQHLFFIMGINDSYETFQKYHIHSVVGVKRNRARGILTPNTYGVYRVLGKELNIQHVLNSEKKLKEQ